MESSKSDPVILLLTELDSWLARTRSFEDLASAKPAAETKIVSLESAVREAGASEIAALLQDVGNKGRTLSARPEAVSPVKLELHRRIDLSAPRAGAERRCERERAAAH